MHNDLIGDNRPPDDLAELRDRLEDSNEAIAARRNELLLSFGRMPEIIVNEETNANATQLVKLIRACMKTAGTAHAAAKQPFLDAGRVVDSWFHSITDPLETARREILNRMTIYQRAVAAEERRRREAEAARKREEADRLRREAEARIAEISRPTIAANDDPDPDDERTFAAALTADELARHAMADAHQAEKAAQAKPAEMSRTRGELGGVASLRTFWDYKDLDRDMIDLETLRAYLTIDDIERAIRGFIAAGGRELRGITIYENTRTQVH